MLSNQLPFEPVAEEPPHTPLVQATPPQHPCGLLLQSSPEAMHATQWLLLQMLLQQSALLPHWTMGEQDILPSQWQEVQVPLWHVWPEQQSEVLRQPESPGLRQPAQYFMVCMPGSVGSAWQRKLQQFAPLWHTSPFEEQVENAVPENEFKVVKTPPPPPASFPLGLIPRSLLRL